MQLWEFYTVLTYPVLSMINNNYTPIHRPPMQTDNGGIL